MAYYLNSNPSSASAAAEFTARPEGNFSVFYARSGEQAEKLKQQLEAAGQAITGESQLDGKPVFLTQGSKTPEQLTQALAAQGEMFAPPAAEHAFNPWKLRGYFSDIGQTLNLISAKFSGKALDASKLIFAALGLSANAVNKIYGAQVEDDPHRLNRLKEIVNTSLQSDLPAGKTLPDVQEKHAEQAPLPKTLLEKARSFVRRYSVRAGEIGLRYFAAIAMVFSITQFKQMGEVRSSGAVTESFSWNRAWENLRKGSPKNGYGLLNTNKTNLWTGSIYLVGRNLSLLFAKTADPYKPNPTALDTFREKYAFPLSSIIEAGAAGTLAAGNFRKDKTTQKRDWVGGLGGLSLMAGLTTRIIAPFGVRQVDMNELYAHTADSLALMPPGDQTQLLARTAAILKENLKDRPETFGQIFIALQERLARARNPVTDSATTLENPPHARTGELAARLPKREATHAEQIRNGAKAGMAIT